MREVPPTVTDPGVVHVLRAARRSLLAIVKAIEEVLPPETPNPPRRLREEGDQRAA